MIIHIFILIIIFGSSRCCFINTRERSADPFSTWTNTAKKKEVNKQNKNEVIFFPWNQYCYYLHLLLPSVTIYFGSSSIFIKFMISYAICKDKNKYWNLDYGQKASAFYWHTCTHWLKMFDKYALKSNFYSYWSWASNGFN